jgi:hypothetical protein
METEIVTNYTLPPWRQPMDSFTDVTLGRVLEKLGAVEDRLSRIEAQISNSLAAVWVWERPKSVAYFGHSQGTLEVDQLKGPET